MAEGRNINDMLRCAMETNFKFYGGLVDLTANYLKSIGIILSESPGQPFAEPQPPARPKPGTSAIVLEAEAGNKALGYFLIKNQLSRKVSAEVAASPIVDADGNSIDQQIHFEPSVLSLEPGENIVVQIIADINEQLEPGVAYRGTVSVPGLTESPAVIVVRRCYSAEASSEQKPPAPKKTKRGTSTHRKPKSTSSKKNSK
jgi:hypothetical protein